MAVWIGFSLSVIFLVLSRLRKVRDVDLRIYLAAAMSPFIAYTIIGVSGTTTASANFGPYSWFAAGIAAYWLAGRAGRFRGALEATAP